MLGASLLSLAAPAQAAGTATIDSFSPSPPYPGGTVVVQGSGCGAGSGVTVFLWRPAGSPVTATTTGTANGEGGFALAVTVPSSYAESDEIGIAASCAAPASGPWDDIAFTALTAAPAPPKSGTATTAKLKRAKVKASKRAVVTVLVRSIGGSMTPSGKFQVRVDGKVRRSVTLSSSSRGRAKVTLPRLKVGRHKVQIRYLGGARHEPSRSKVLKLQVVRR
ncbi:Ig-like domain repeat protein [Nocardioides sp. Bht2]|uniref:Ig-like domain repeat protein n=1 Tax=Nocardioides sp. Bht2 TaxID=3392297 RepID=UPI0039B5B50A